MRTNRWFIISLIAVLSLVLAACGGAATPTKAPEPTKAPAVQPTAVPAAKAPEPTKAAGTNQSI